MAEEFRHIRKKKRRKPSIWVTTLDFFGVPRSFVISPTVLFLLLLVCSPCNCVSRCRVEACTNDFRDRLEQLGPEFEGVDFGSAADRMRGMSSGSKFAHFCHLLSDCSSCLKSISGSCYGDFNHRSALKVVSDWREQFDCEHASFYDEEPLSDACTFVPPDFTEDEEEDDEDVYAHCSLFGDPHLINYSGNYQTCRIDGAWPLVDNDFLAVQVTSAKVCNHCLATAPIRVTVIVKDAGECGPQLTYEATAEVLSKSFNDGTTFAGVDKSTEVEERVEGREVQIRVRHAGSVLSIRRVGGIGQFPSLAISVRSPKASIPPRNRDLCSAGCPNHATLSHPDTTLNLGIDFHQAAKACSRRDLTDAFLDSCVFDLISTGDLGFAEAAQFAQADLKAMNPQVAKNLLQNRTSTEVRVTSGAAPLLLNFLLLVVCAIGRLQLQ